MLEEVGTVIKTQDTYAQVQMARSSACAHCGICTMGVNNTMVVEAENLVGAKIGDRVKVAIESSAILKATSIVYLLPLIGLLIGYFVLEKISGQTAGVIGGIIGVIIILCLIPLYDKRLKKHNRFAVKIIQVV